MTHTISEHLPTQIIEIHQLLHEYDRQAIVNDIEQYIGKGFDQLVIDLSHLPYLNSVGLNFLLRLLRDHDGNLSLANPSDQALRLLEVTRLKARFQLFPTVEEAIKTFNES